MDARDLYPATDPTPKTHIDPHGAEFAIACLYCGRVHRTKAERRDIRGNVVKDVPRGERQEHGRP